VPRSGPVACCNWIPLIYCFCSIILSTLYDVIFEQKEDQEALV